MGFSDLGCSFMSNNRSAVYGFVVALMTLSFILLTVAMAGGSTSSGNIENCAWATVSSGGADYYFGTVAGYLDSNLLQVTEKYKDCTEFQFCKDCQDPGQTALGCTVVVWIASIVFIILSVLRMRGDGTFLKVMAVLTGSFMILFMIVAMGNWNQECMTKIHNDLDGVSKDDVDIGPGLGSEIAAFFFTLSCLIIHLTTPVEDFDSGSGQKMGNDNQA